ncbi:MAG: hypothetical protein JXM70_15940 [Pirellulales bacterium]|nr:hypothetical protein [Pirellulales bacterium]
MTKSPTELVFLGATAFCEIAEIVRDINRIEPTYSIRAILDDNPDLHGTMVEGTPVVGPLEECRRFPDARIVMGIGSYKTRMVRHAIIERLGLPEDRYATLIHPTAKIYPTVEIGAGCIVQCGAVIAADTVLEPFAHVLFNSFVGVGNRICRGALLTSLVSTAGGVTVGHYAHLGTTSSVAENRTIAAGAQVAMGSVVIRDVPLGAFVLGNPARRLRSEKVDESIVRMWENRDA